jgi:uncharacterized repeat protein (TIGR03803 family)
MGALVQDRDGNFYGTTAFGGAHGDGTVFKITRSGELTTLYSFCSQSDCADGELPYAALVQDRDGNFYGTTYRGGTYNKGTVFKITPWGALTTLHSFEGTDGASPYYAALVQDSDGDFYGTTQLGGTYNKGTVFKITPWDTLTTLLSFQCTATEGCEPDAGLVQGSHGKFYGTTYYGGPTSGPCSPHGCGTVFSLSGIPR